MTANGIGAPVVRADDRRLLTGGGRYLDDIAFPGLAHGVVLRSPHPHAAIAGIDTAEAARMPGVLAVLDGRGWDADGHGFLPCEDKRSRPDGTPMIDPPRPALVRDRVRFVGDPVAFVVGETVECAMDAAERIAVDYRPLPCVTTTGQALGADATAVWTFCPDNVAFAHEEGDAAAVAAAIERAPHVIRRRFAINRITGAMMEPRGCVGLFDAHDGRYTLHSGVQNPHTLRRDLAQAVFGVAESRVRVVCGDIGGSFGTRGPNYPELVLVLWAARKIGRPVKWVSSRSEGLATDDHARECATEAALALDRDGRFLALRVSTDANLGAYLSTRAGRARPSAISARSPGSTARRRCTSRCAGSTPTPPRPRPIAARARPRPPSCWSVWSTSHPANSACRRPSCGASTPSRPTACRGPTRSATSTIAATSRPISAARWTRPTMPGSRRAGAKRKGAAGCAASASPIRSRRPRPRSSRPPRSGSILPAG